MDILRIEGGRPLSGSVHVSGAKNAALPMLAATLLTSEPCVLQNVPQLSDVRSMLGILEYLGTEVSWLDNTTVQVQSQSIKPLAPYDLVRRMRASICVLGPLLGRLREAKVSLPGGCVFGQRPIDLHLKGLAKLGCTWEMEGGYVVAQAPNLQGARVFLGGPQGSTVTGTTNILSAAVLAPGVTRIESAACEPEVTDLCSMLVEMGAQIEGIGSSILTITGVKSLKGCRYRIIEDRIEAGTWLMAGPLTDGEVTVHGARLHHLGAVLDRLEDAGVELDCIDMHTIRARRGPQGLKTTQATTFTYPGLPTDLQAQLTTLLTAAPGISIITERIYPQRFMHVPELQRMGADIRIEGSSAIVQGGSALSGAPVMSSDLRASISLVLAGLAAKGQSLIQRIYHLDRGYADLDSKLLALGAPVERVSAPGP